MEKITLVGIQEAADFLKISSKTLIRWEAQGYIHHIKLENSRRLYSMNNIMELLDLKRKPYLYFLQMINAGLLPNALSVIGKVDYDNGCGTWVEDFSDIPAGARIFYVTYRKRKLIDKNINEVFKVKKDVYLKHFDENHLGPIGSIVPEPPIIQLKKADKNPFLTMDDIWKNDKEYFNRPEMVQLIPPKSFYGFECFEDNCCFVKYERIKGGEWLADEIENEEIK